MTDKLKWTNGVRRLGDLVDWPNNPRHLSDHNKEHIDRSLEQFDYVDPIIVNLDNTIVGGHQRRRCMAAMEQFGPDVEIDVRIPNRQLVESEVAQLNIRLNRNVGDWDWDALSDGFEWDDLLDWGFTKIELDENIGDFDDFEWDEYDESDADDVKMITCPECGYEFPK